MSWGMELWDQLDNVEKHTAWGLEFVDKLSKFAREKADIELAYAKQLRSLVKKYQPKKSSKEDDEIRYTYVCAMENLTNEVGDFAGQRELVAETLMGKVATELLRVHTTVKHERKTMIMDGKRHQQNLENCGKQLEVARKRYEREFREWEKAQQLLEKTESEGIKAEIDKVKQQAAQRQRAHDESKADYAMLHATFNEEQKKHYFTIMPGVLKSLQELDGQRVSAVGAALTITASREQEVLPIMSKCVEGMKKAADSVQPDTDAQRVIEAYKSGFQIPGDVSFEDLSQAGSHDLGASGKGKLILWPWKRTKGPPAEDFSHLPPEQRRKKLQHKMDELNRDITKESDQCVALQKMRDVYTKNPQLGDTAILDPQIHENKLRLDKLKQELHKYETWMVEVDGKPLSRSISSRTSSYRVSQGPPESPTTTCRPSQPTSSESFDDEFDDDDDIYEAEPQKEPFKQCRAAYAFPGDSDGTIAVAEGEVLWVVEADTGQGWTLVKRQTGPAQGYVPTTYLLL
ncbi:formin-binding protein 1-like [Lethenteron reissneri]|uniref:formin-binding protein 1-like n=1 Tax=Lethenteron reissneri TaxID=7753 RepID=UPI002AB7B1A4|nr:formin-binding protein 1-like [Lethenteron reissneri]